MEQRLGSRIGSAALAIVLCFSLLGPALSRSAQAEEASGSTAQTEQDSNENQRVQTAEDVAGSDAKSAPDGIADDEARKASGAILEDGLPVSDLPAPDAENGKGAASGSESATANEREAVGNSDTAGNSEAANNSDVAGDSGMNDSSPVSSNEPESDANVEIFGKQDAQPIKEAEAELAAKKQERASVQSTQNKLSTQSTQNKLSTQALSTILVQTANQTIEVGEIIPIIALALGGDEEFSYESSDIKVVTVEVNDAGNVRAGIARAESPGKAVVTIKNKAGGSGTVTIEVIPKVTQSDFEIDGTTLVSYKGSDTTVYVPGTIKTIGDGTKAVFPSSVTSVQLPLGLTTIAAKAFEKSNITSLTLPEGVTSIGASAFSTTQFTTLTMPSTMKAIGSMAFFNAKLKNVQLNEGLETIADNAFSQTRIVGVTIPASVKSIGDTAFDYEYYSGYDTYIVIKGKDTQLHDNAIPYYYALAVYAPESSTAQALVDKWKTAKGTSCKMTFYPLDNFKAATGLTLSQTTAEISRKGTVALTAKATPEGALSEALIWSSSQPKVATVDNKGVVTGVHAGTATITATAGTLSATCEVSVIKQEGESDFTINAQGLVDDYLGSDTEWTIPGTIENKTVVGIADGAFAKNKMVTKVTLPASCISIGKSAFANCDNLTTINLQNVTKLGTSAFENAGLTSIVLGNGLTEVSESAFSRCNALTQVTLPASVKRLAKNSFLSCMNLRTLTLNEGLESIGEGALRATRIATLHFPSTFKTLGDKNVGDPFEVGGQVVADKSMTAVTVAANNPNFSAQDGLLYSKDKKTLVFCPRGRTTATIVEGCETIGDYACFMCFDLKTVQLPKSLKTVGQGAFQYDEGITSMELPIGLTTVKKSGFFGCELWTGVDRLPSTLRSIGAYGFAECLGSRLVIPEGVTTIEEFAFWGYEDGLQSIKLPSTLTTIANSAFSWAKAVKTLVVPEGVTSIGNEAFARLDSLSYVKLPSTLTTVGERAFMGDEDGQNLLASIYIPENVSAFPKSVLQYRDSTAVTAKENSTAWNTLTTAGFDVKPGTPPADLPATIAVPAISGTTGIKAEGTLSGINIAEGSTVTMSAQLLTTGQAYQALVAAVGTNTLLGVFEVGMSVNGDHTHDGFGTITLKFPVDAQYNGRTVVVTHLHADGSITSERCVVRNGEVAVSVSDLSSFALALEPQAANNTGETGNTGTAATPGTTNTPGATTTQASLNTADASTSNDAPSTGKASGLPQTGDETVPMSVFALVALSAALVGMLAFKRFVHLSVSFEQVPGARGTQGARGVKGLHAKHKAR